LSPLFPHTLFRNDVVFYSCPSRRMLTRTDILVSEDAADFLAAALSVRLVSGWEEEPAPGGAVRFVIHTSADAAGARFLRGLLKEIRALVPAVRDIRSADAADEDWRSAWREFFTPVPCGERFLVLPPWLERGERDAGRLPVVIEPRSAFGTGHHASTALCLEELSDLYDAGEIGPGMEFLDLGTGSGILGIACCRLGLSGLGLDTDPLAIENARENRERNACAAFETTLGGVEAAAGRRFDVVLANILASPLKDMAPDLVRLLKREARLVLSGLLSEQGDAVEAAYRAEGLGPARRREKEGWIALIWGRAQRPPAAVAVSPRSGHSDSSDEGD
jgi:ribosomal protein L11 methyltransferase